MTEYHSGQAAAVVNANLKSPLSTMEKAKQNAILWFGEILDRGLFRSLVTVPSGSTPRRNWAGEEQDL